jgi:hypothetical protein
MSASESFVDVTYFGFEIGRRLRIGEFGPTTAYLEHPTPLPVGTALDIVTDDAGAIRATVLRVQEQVAGTERSPGMHVRAEALAGAPAAWWAARVTQVDPRIPDLYAPNAPLRADDAGDTSVPDDTEVSAHIPIDPGPDGATTQRIDELTERQLTAAAASDPDAADTQVMGIIKREELRAQAQRAGSERRSTIVMSSEEIRDAIGRDPEDGNQAAPDPAADESDPEVTDGGAGAPGSNGDARAQQPEGKKKKRGRRRKR